MHLFERWLRERFGSTPPLGHCLRTDHRLRWLRLHSLPSAKRYADDDSERSEVRRRAWAAASEVLPTGAPVWLVMGLFDANEARDLQVPEAPSMRFELAGSFEHPLLEVPYVAYVMQTTWPHPDFDQLIDAIANDARRAAWFSSDTGEVFAPYDGGIDLILETPERVESVRRVFPPAWFSRRPDGL